MSRRFSFFAFIVASVFIFAGSFANAQMSNVPRLTNITLVEEGETYPAVVSGDGAIQIKPGKLLKERNMQSLARLLGNYIGWPADGSTVEAIGRTLASWGKGNSLYFNLLSPISIPPNLTLTLYPKGSGPSFLTYTQPKLSDLDIWNTSASTTKAPSYWVDMEEPTAQGGSFPQKNAVPFSNNAGTVNTMDNNNAVQRKDVLLRDMNQQLQNTREEKREMEERLRGLETELNQFRDKSQQSSTQLKNSLEVEQGLEARLRALQGEKEQLTREAGSLAQQLEDAQASQMEADKSIRSVTAQRAQEYSPSRSVTTYQRDVENEVRSRPSSRNEGYVAPSYRSNEGNVFPQTGQQNRSFEDLEGIDLLQSSLPSSSGGARSYVDQAAADARFRQLQEERNQLRQSSQSLDQQLEDSRSNQQAVERRIQALNAAKQTSGGNTIRLDDESPLTVDVTPETDLKSLTPAYARKESGKIDQQKEVEHEVQQRINVMVEELQKEQNSTTPSDSSPSEKTIPVIDEEPPDSLQMRQEKPSHDSLATQQPRVQGHRLLARAGIRKGIQLVSFQKKLPMISASMTDASQAMIKRVIVTEKGEGLAVSIPRGVIINMAQLPTQAEEKIKSSAQTLLDKPFSMEAAKHLGMEIGMALKTSGKSGCDIVLLKREIANGTLSFEIRKTATHTMP